VSQRTPFPSTYAPLSAAMTVECSTVVNECVSL
jgi:hypothetical protein